MKILKKNVLLSLVCVLLGTSCSNKPCRIEERKASSMAQDSKVAPVATTVFVYKADGSLQCGEGVKIGLDKMKQDLKGINVISSVNKHDGMMRTQVCGAPTGFSNVYEIKSTDLEAALKLGFKQWKSQ